MSPDLHHECTRVPVTALAACGPILLVAEGPYLRLHHRRDYSCVATEQIFKSQAIHGASVQLEDPHHATIVIWGGPLIRALEIHFSNHAEEVPWILRLSNVVKAPDWILDLSFGPTAKSRDSTPNVRTCGAVTAHNALLELTVEYQAQSSSTADSLKVLVSELTSSSRSILYSAHLLWESPNIILIAAGTAFGEIIYWSWTRESPTESSSQTHQVFLGHEGSVFGVQISKDLASVSSSGSQRYLASCSDDRTIRIWDISHISLHGDAPEVNEKAERTRHTGFSNASYDKDATKTDCLAIGWGHISRVWTVKFLEAPPSASGVFLSSSGEDATSRIWKLTLPNSSVHLMDKRSPLELILLDTAAFHSGKNMWSTAVWDSINYPLQMVCGAADSKIIAHPISSFTTDGHHGTEPTVMECTVQDIVSAAQTGHTAITSTSALAHKSSKTKEFFRSYTFIDETSFLLTTNSGRIYLASSQSSTVADQSHTISDAKFIDQLEDLVGYSICTSVAPLNMAFIAGSKGSIYMYRQGATGLLSIHTVNGKVGNIFAVREANDLNNEAIYVLITLVGQQVAQLLRVETSKDNVSAVSSVTEVPTSNLTSGLPIESMEYITTTSKANYLLLGLRKGSIAAYSLSGDSPGTTGITVSRATFHRIIEKVHGREAVTSMIWVASAPGSPDGHLISVGRDGCISTQSIDFCSNSVLLVHNLTLPVGPNLEGVFVRGNHVIVYGFSSKKFVLYNTTTEEEIISIETGGAHRSWAFQPRSREDGGTLVWTRASGMHVYAQEGQNHQVIRTGGHGREIKAVDVSYSRDSIVSRQLIATGAEDTDIKIMDYDGKNFCCRRTLRKHVTGIQNLLWSDNGEYLFSSGGCEEFYIWRVRQLPALLGIGIVCESIYAPESEHSDLRVMSFDVWRQESEFLIAMVFSDSSTKVYRYNPTAMSPWRALTKGIYFTSCLTQCKFLSPTTILTAGTDGHAVFWPLCFDNAQLRLNPSSTLQALTWKNPVRIHQNTSKTLASHALGDSRILIVSGGDDGGISFLIASQDVAVERSYTSPPIIVTRAHASAISACIVVPRGSQVFILTSGNDEWVRLWEVCIGAPGSDDPLEIKRVKKIKTNVADVSSMAFWGDKDGNSARILLCGVGMEVIRIEW